MRLSGKLAALGAFFVVALVIAGCGSSIPSDSVAVVAGNKITTRAFDHWMYVAAKGNAEEEQGAAVIVPNDPPGFANCIKQARAQIPSLAKTSDKEIKADCKELFTSLSSQVMEFLIESYWYQLDAHRLHITLTKAELATAFAQAKKGSNLTTTAKYDAFLTETGQTQADILYRVRVNELYKKLIDHYSVKVTPAAIAAYYKDHASSFGSAETRNLRIVRTNGEAPAKAAYAALKSGQSWQTVAKKYSVDTATKNNGGLLTGVTSGEEEQALNKVAFSAPTNKLEGPIHGSFGWYVVEVIKIVPATHESLAKATSTIKSDLTSQHQQAAETAIDKQAKKLWGAKTLCLASYSMDDCSGYKAPKTTSTATSTTSTTPSTSSSTTTTSSNSTGTTTTKKHK